MQNQCGTAEGRLSCKNRAAHLSAYVPSPLVAGTAAGLLLDDARLTRLCAGLEIASDLLDRRPKEVSIGHAQRAGILRALIAAPPLVLFDEPLSALGAATRKRTARLIAQMQGEEGFRPSSCA